MPEQKERSTVTTADQEEYLDFLSNVMEIAHSKHWTVQMLKGALKAILQEMDGAISCPNGKEARKCYFDSF